MDQTPMEGPEAKRLVEEAGQLVQALNSPGNAAIAKSIQERLQTLQKSEAGWVIADGLLGSEDSNSRFFGALTLTIKIHQDWDHLGNDRKNGILVHLVDLFILQVQKAETAVVLRKFMTTMSTFFFKQDSPWKHAIRHVAMSLANGKYLPEEQCPQDSFEKLAVPSLNYGQALALLSFSATLAEESLRHSIFETEVVGRFQANTKDALFLADFVFHQTMNNLDVLMVESPHAHDTRKAATEAVRSFHVSMKGALFGSTELTSIIIKAWISASGNRISQPDIAGPLTYIVQFLMVPSLAPTSMDVVSEVLNHQPKLLHEDLMRSILVFLTGEHGEKYALALLEGDFEDDVMQFLDLLLRYASNKQLYLLTGPLSDQDHRILFLLHKLFQGPGFAGVDDKASPLVLEFWTEAADDLYDAVLQDLVTVTEARVKGCFAQVITECYDKLRYPDPSTLEEWEDDDAKSFSSFRRDFSDFLLATYPLLGVDVIQLLQERAAAAMENQTWDRFEVAIYCLASLSESVAENRHADELLHKLFHSPQFDNICFNRIPIPAKSRQTLSDMIAKYTAYFERNHELLPRVLNLLFNSLETPLCDQAAAKSISILCQNCRQALPVYLNEFIDRFEQLRSIPSIASTTLERVAEGIAAVAQALPSDDAKAASLVQLLGPLCQLAEEARQEAQTGDQEEALARGHKAIRCTASIGKGFRAQDDVVIDIDAEETSPDAQAFWNAGGPGGAPQTYVIQILEILMSTFGTDGDMIEATCEVLKAGYTERRPGPYVLPPHVSVQFVKMVNILSAQFPAVMATASAFLASQASRASEVKDISAELILHVYEVMSYMNNVPQQYDPDVAHSCIDFLTRLLPKHGSAFFGFAHLSSPQAHQPVLPTIFNFTLAVLKGPDPLPLRSASSFWSTILTLPDVPAEFQPGTPSHQHTFDQVLQSLANILMRQVSGHCARSDLDHLSEVIKKFIFKHQGSARLHFSNALATLDDNEAQAAGELKGSLVSKEERDKFLAGIVALRGARKTNTVVREFWLKCRGKGFEYTS
ncbi:hypothetical protein AJ80_08706 [Polytolypa hystricis UAMH7299]|uniref:Importin N-terminal domain-containing protein n=1 Tax=Polytolypa hystricis (strain UAMH7299) TaxID=1447883 RepID=A0A2B7X2R7_POLH7|nr:hypothetical protein AJ80_08706 [Polytolypa hystricis UAMH7299]